jgi:HAD superfamily hydrolase (TIGR01509 family)
MRVSAVIFDMDGLMVDTEPVYQIAWKQAAAELGYDLDDTLYSTFVGRPTPACEAIIIERFGAAFPLERFRERWPALWRSEVDTKGIETKPGLEEILALVESHRLPMAVATSSEADYVEVTLRQAGLANRFDAMVTGDEIVRGKPEPDIYLEAARKLGVPPSDCVALEDSEAGILAIQRAGMTGILVPHWPASQRAVQAAFQVVETLHEARAVLTSLISP